MDGNGTTSGQITFGTEELKCNWCHGDERQYGFSGIFSGQPISGTYTYTIPGAYQLGLMYTYHHHTVAVIGWLHKINPDHMELTDIASYETHKAAYSASDFNKVATGLHLYHGDVIHLMRGDMSNMNMN